MAVCAHVILDARANIFMHVLFKQRDRYSNTPSMDVSIV